MKSGSPSTPLFVGLTIVYVVLAAWASMYIEPPQTAADWGNALAGVFSPLAFLWLLYAALAQRAELELQRQELKENNVTQKNQQEQMSRQANAMEAQTERASAQADASYQPVLFLETSSQGNNGAAIHLRNMGANILDVEALGNSEIVSHHGKGGGRSISDGIAPLLLSGDLIIVDGVSPVEPHFEIAFTRVDSVRKINRYECKNSLRRVVLASVREADLDKAIHSHNQRDSEH